MSETTACGCRVVYAGRVQGVGFRATAVALAQEFPVYGWVRNLADGRVEVYAAGTEANLSQLAGLLHRGPRWAEVQAVEEQEAEVRTSDGFQIEP